MPRDHRAVGKAYNRGGPDALDELLARGWQSNSWPEDILPKSVENATALHRRTLRIFPERHHTTEDVIGEGHRVVQRFTLAGTHLSEFFGLMPNWPSSALAFRLLGPGP